MKKHKFTCLIMAGAMVLSMTACGNSDADSTEPEIEIIQNEESSTIAEPSAEPSAEPEMIQEKDLEKKDVELPLWEDETQKVYISQIKSSPYTEEAIITMTGILKSESEDMEEALKRGFREHGLKVNDYYISGVLGEPEGGLERRTNKEDGKYTHSSFLSRELFNELGIDELKTVEIQWNNEKPVVIDMTPFVKVGASTSAFHDRYQMVYEDENLKLSLRNIGETMAVIAENKTDTAYDLTFDQYNLISEGFVFDVGKTAIIKPNAKTFVPYQESFSSIQETTEFLLNFNYQKHADETGNSRVDINDLPVTLEVS